MPGPWSRALTGKIISGVCFDGGEKYMGETHASMERISKLKVLTTAPP